MTKDKKKEKEKAIFDESIKCAWCGKKKQSKGNKQNHYASRTSRKRKDNQSK